MSHVIACLLEFEIVNPIIEWIVIFVMDMHTERNWSALCNPHITVKRVRRSLPLVVAPIINTMSTLLGFRISLIDFASVQDRERFHNSSMTDAFVYASVYNYASIQWIFGNSKP